MTRINLVPPSTLHSKHLLAETVQSAEHCLWARNGHEPCQHVKPMQDVTELVEAVTCLLQLIRREAPQLSGKVMGFAETALSKYKGAK